MNTYIVLLRGINVGGKNLLPMNELKLLLESNGFENVSTYIQSGNIILQSNTDPKNVMKTLIQSQFGFSPEILVLSDIEFDLSVKNNPFSEHEGKLVHFYYCKNTPKMDIAKLKKFISETESYELSGNVFYLHAPDGIGRSKLVANIESCLGIPATGRNLNTINKLMGMIANA
ncbi:MAG: DUF1697 domain-containing protein [Glaciecola sp.]